MPAQRDPMCFADIPSQIGGLALGLPVLQTPVGWDD